MAPSKVWLITGCSSGLGSQFAKAALAHGDKVIATARNIAKLDQLKAAGAATLALDVTAGDEKVMSVIAEALKIYGTIDILVNNAAYALTGTVEESSDVEVQAQFETNVFGHLTVIRAVLPHMRSRKTGVIANVGSIGGWKGILGSGAYCATKFALVGITGSLREEVAHLGIEATIIEPGSFRTELLGNLQSTANVIDDYRPLMDPFKEFLTSLSANQPGDPAKAAQVVVEALTKSGRCEGRTLPLRLPLGSDAVSFVGGVLEQDTKSLGEWADIVSTTNYDEVTPQ